MSMDATLLGHTAAELMEMIDEAYDGDDVSLGVVAVVVEVNGTDWTTVQYRCSDPRAWVQRGLFATAIDACGRGRG